MGGVLGEVGLLLGPLLLELLLDDAGLAAASSGLASASLFAVAVVEVAGVPPVIGVVAPVPGGGVGDAAVVVVPPPPVGAATLREVESYPVWLPVGGVGVLVVVSADCTVDALDKLDTSAIRAPCGSLAIWSAATLKACAS